MLSGENCKQSFYNYLRFEKRYSDHTFNSYQKDLNQFELFLNESFKLDNINHADHRMIRAWLVSLVNQEIKARTVNRKLSTIKSYYKFACKNEWVKTNPASKLNGLKTPARLPSFVEEKDIQKLLDRNAFDESFEGTRDFLIINLLYATGIRRQELVSLKEADVDFMNESIRVLGKGNKERIIPLGRSLSQLIKEYLEERNKICPHEYIFITLAGKQVYPKLVYNIVKKHLAAITTLVKKSPHILRHSFATHLLNGGAELNAVKELLGHSSLAATQIYTHNSIEQLKEIYKQAHPKS